MGELAEGVTRLTVTVDSCQAASASCQEPFVRVRRVRMVCLFHGEGTAGRPRRLDHQGAGGGGGLEKCTKGESEIVMP